MSDQEQKLPDVRPDKTVFRSLALGGMLGGGGECAVDVKDGKAVRIRPFHYDWKYDREHLNSWTMRRNGETLQPLMKSLPSPFSLAYKKRTFSPNRIKYPLKRVDWNPQGERNPQNRGKSTYQRISWDEATDIIAAEIRRVHEQYGPLGVLVQGDGHGECLTIHTPHGHSAHLLDLMGGFTQQVRNPDSWEGWYWGAKHVWGQGFQGMMSPANNLIKDITEHSELLLFWGGDPETTPWGFTGQYATRICQFWTRAGIEQVYICPDLNYGAAIHAGKWIPILPNTDAALQLAIIHVWLTEGTWDKEYVATHAVGMDKVADYVLGKEDGVAKTPSWATKKCGVPPWTIKALARKFAKQVTSIVHYFGGSMIRGPFSHEPGRLECILLGMQGLGAPGVHQCQITYFGMPRAEGIKSARFFNPALSERIRTPVRTSSDAWGKQLIPKTLIQEAILRPPLTFMGSGGQESDTDDQFIKYTYPIPKEDGGTEIHMIWTDTPCRITCWNHGNWTIEAYRSPKIECIVAQHPWLENDCLYADLILPVNTTLEVEDIVTNTRQGPHFQSIMIQEQAIAPIGESKSDYEVVLEVAKKLGLGEQFTEGMTTRDLQMQVFQDMEVTDFITWDEFEDKKYFVFPTAHDWEDDTPGLRDFHDDPVAHPLPTPTGKLEFYSEALAQHFPYDAERPPYPKWIERTETHDERISSERADMFPLLLMSNHGRWRTHSQCDDITWTREIPTCKVLGFDGYKYEPLWINPRDAAERGIKDGDVVKVFNERGIVLAGARVWERIMPRVVYIDHGARHDPISERVDRGGAINAIAPNGLTSRNAVGQATSGYLVDVQKVRGEEWDEWRRDHPEAFAREYDHAAGLRFDAWIEGEKA
ncbi:MAG: molybdopterin-dependent oxidoreductase [Thermoleophilia bacterium]|jgi:molybdopterin guanine dinucleotide-containing S/N-oxide reductase-like protein